MHQGRRKSKMNSQHELNYVNLKTVEVGRDQSGYGFTVTGQYPCALGTILTGSPAAVAGLTPDVCVLAINGENVTRMGHEQIIKLIGATEGVLRLTVADAVAISDSSDDDYNRQRKPRTRHQQYRSKSAIPSTPNSRAEMVVAELQRGLLFNPYESHSMYSPKPRPATAVDDAKFAPGHLSLFNQTGHQDLIYKKSPQLYADEALQHALPKLQKPHKLRHSERSQSAVPHNSSYERYDPIDDLDEDRALSPTDLSNVMYPSLQHRTVGPRSRSPHRHPPTITMNQPAMMRCIVGYLGSIDIPASANLPTASLQAIRGCVRRLRMEQRVHSLMLMEITSIGVTLINSNRKVTVLYPADKVAFSGVCPDDKRVFGIVTAQSPEDAVDSIDSDEEPIGSSCHVFFVDSEVSHHNIHAQCATQFGVQCSTDPDTGLCEEFPSSTKLILYNVSQLYRDRQHNIHYGNVYGQSPYNGLGIPRRSNSNSSNSDSGFGNGNGNTNGQQDTNGNGDHIILNVAAHIRNQRSQGYLPVTSPVNTRLSNTSSMSQSSDYPFLMSSNVTPRSSTERSPQNGISPSSNPSGRLTPRARPNPVGYQSPSLIKQTATNVSRQCPQNMNLMQQHQTKANFHLNNSASPDWYTANQRPDNVMYNPSLYGPPVIQTKKYKPQVPPRMKTAVKGLPPSGRDSMYPTVRPEMMHDAKQEDETDGCHIKWGWRQDVRRNSDCSEYSWSHGPKSSNTQKNVRSRKVQLLEPGTTESLAASDGELETRGDEVIGTSTNGTGDLLCVPKNIPKQSNIGRVSSWAVSFERLLQDELGLECFTQFLKVEFSEENIMFWIACEQMGKLKNKAELEKHAQDIYDKYMAPKATMPVNLEGQCLKLVEEAIRHPTPEMFNSQQQQIFKLMKFDSYTRFLKSKMYQDYILAEMAHEPLPPLKPTTETEVTKLTVAENKAAKKKAAKKKHRKLSTSSENSTPTDSLEKKRRPLLPWNKVLPGKSLKKNSGDLSHSPDDDNVSRTSSMSDAVENGGMELGLHGKYQQYSTAVRFYFPNNDTVTVPARSGCSVREAISSTCEARQLPLQALEIFQSESRESKHFGYKWKRKISTDSTASDDKKNLVDLEQELSTLAGAEVIIERRIIFKIELPNHRVIGVKSKPNKKIIEVLRPVTYKYKLMLDSLVVHLSESPVPLDMDITVASLDGQRILIETMEQYSAGTYKPQNGDGRLFKANSTDSLLSQKADPKGLIRNGSVKQTEVVPLPMANLFSANNEAASRLRINSTSRVSKVRDHAQLGRTPSADSNVRTKGSKKRGNLRVTGQDTEDLIAQLTRANRRLDDQRGLTIKDLELPDFLKQPEKPTMTTEDTGSQPKTSQEAPEKYTVSKFLKSRKTKPTTKATADVNNGRRSESTPPSTGLAFKEGSIPTHAQAEALFGTSGGSISHMHFNNSMMNLNGKELAGWGGRPSYGMNESGVSFQSSSSETSSNTDQFSPRSYNSTLQNVIEHRSMVNLHLDSSDMNDSSVNYGNSEADKTLVEAGLNDTVLPPPPTPETLNRTLELANYSPPPPVSIHHNEPLPVFTHQKQPLPISTHDRQLPPMISHHRQPPPMTTHHKQLAASNSGPQGSTIPGHKYNPNHVESNLEDPMLRYSANRSPGPPSPSTHDLVGAPDGDQDPYFAECSQISYSTESTVTESSAHFGNSSYSGHSTYSSNSSQSINNDYNRPPYFPRSTSDTQFQQAPPCSSVPTVMPKPYVSKKRANATSLTGQKRGKDRTEMVIIGKDGRRMRASFV